jgi:EH domain-containing protein 1
LINGPEERTIPGNALSVHPDLPFRGLERFGVSFLSRFEGSQVPSSVLRSVTLVDTPGILSGEKQRLNRGYDFTKVIAWFAEVSKVKGICCDRSNLLDSSFFCLVACRPDHLVV